MGRKSERLAGDSRVDAGTKAWQEIKAKLAIIRSNIWCIGRIDIVGLVDAIPSFGWMCDVCSVVDVMGVGIVVVDVEITIVVVDTDMMIVSQKKLGTRHSNHSEKRETSDSDSFRRSIFGTKFIRVSPPPPGI